MAEMERIEKKEKMLQCMYRSTQVGRTNKLEDSSQK